MRKRTSSGCFSGKMNLEMGNNIDLSLLRRPLTPFTGFQEAKNAFDKGTTEVRHLLLYECGLIYECNVCRNMFRSLANFISHKRVFCCTSAKEYNGTHNSTNGMEGMHGLKHHSREYMLAKHESELRQNKQMMSKEPSAVINVESEEKQLPHEENENNNQKQKSLRKEIETENKKRDHNAKPTDQVLHKSKENPTSAYVFQCPSCSLTFLKSSAVICHLAIVHNLPIRRIRMMRDSLLKSRTEAIMEGVEKPKTVKKNHELKGLLANETSLSGNEEKKDYGENDQTTLKCDFCKKSFGRQAHLATHMQNCSAKYHFFEQQEQAVVAPMGKRIKIETSTQAMPMEAAIAADIDCQLIDYKKEDVNESDTLTLNASLDDEDVKRTFVDLEKQTFGAGLQTVSLDKLDMSAGESSSASLFAANDVPEVEMSKVSASKVVEKTATVSGEISSTTSNTSSSAALMSIKKRRMRISNAQVCRCKICGKQFNALSNLRRHISMFHYRARKFGCALCDYCAFRRYDIINHLNFVHKLDTENDASSKDLVRVNDVPYTKDDMNDDIVLCSTDELDSSAGEAIPSSSAVEEKPVIDTGEHPEEPKPEKRQRRRHNKSLSALADNNILTADINAGVKLTRQKLKRSQSQTLEGTYSPKATQKRPRRNRTKPVNKDFVYDLSGLIKKDMPQQGNLANDCETYHLRGSKRRNTLIAHLENVSTVAAFHPLKIKNSSSIKGTARRTCLLLVNQGLAASSTLPEIPAERPQMRPRLTSTQRSDSQAGPIIETTELEAARLKSLPLCDDSYLEKIANESVGSFKIKPCLEQQQQQHSALDSLLQKFDSSKQLNGIARCAPNENLITTQPDGIKDEQLNSCALLNSSLLETANNDNNTALASLELPSILTTPEQAIPKTLSIPTKPQKRLLPSLDRLNETINSFENFFTAQLEN